MEREGEGSASGRAGSEEVRARARARGMRGEAGEAMRLEGGGAAKGRLTADRVLGAFQGLPDLGREGLLAAACGLLSLSGREKGGGGEGGTARWGGKRAEG